MSARVHPTAVIDHTAVLAEGVEVGPYCVVGPHVRIGAGTVLQNHVTVQEWTSLGKDNIVFPFAVLGAEPQDLKYAGGTTRLEIGDRNKIREHATIHRGTELGGSCTRIGSDCMLMIGVHVAHDCTIEDEVVIANGTMLGGHCLIETGVGIGGGVGLHHFTSVGTQAFIGGMSRISRDVPPYCVVEGCPAEPKKINTTALLRRKRPQSEVDALREAFRLLFRTPETPVSETISELRERTPRHEAVMRLCDFVERTDTGVHGRQLERHRSASSRRG